VLARKYRLNKRAIGHVFKRGTRLHTPFFAVLFTNKYHEFPQYSVVISNKQVSIAPQRSRIKRRLRAMIRQVFTDIPYDAIFLAKPAVLKATWPELLTAGKEAYQKMQHLSASGADKSIPADNIT